MKYDMKIMWLEIKSRFVWFCIAIFFLYGVLLPFQMNLVGIFDRLEDAKHSFFESAQKCVPIISLWYSFWFVRRILEGDAREVLYYLDRRSKIRYAVYFYVIYVISIAPLLVWYHSMFPENGGDLFSLGFQGMFVQMLFFVLGYLLRSAILGFVSAFILNMILLAVNGMPYHLDKLFFELSEKYILCSVGVFVCLTAAGILVERLSINKGRLFDT